MENSVSVELIAPSSSNWEFFGKQIYYIEQSVFSEKSFNEEMMKSDINDPKATLVLLKDKESIVGFTYALPETQGVARIVDTAITKEYQNKGLVSILMSCLEKELRNKGYEYVTRDVMIENGYADKIMKNYSSKIVETKEFIGRYGKQRHFKIRI
ncbi:MAG: GNAT family N-acetyltransferase [Candidatus Zambryskibacteria bacterium]|nr:GNAT family N-acetyltransferase [Candidatus Zambryskibacteria bacterium]